MNDKRLSTAGQQVGDYKIEALLGTGGMGEVYLATDKLGRRVALKLLAERFDKDKRHVARFLQEARTVLTLNHPNIVTVYDIGQTDSGYYIASELIEGETLRRRLEQGLFLADVLDIFIQVASALVAAHDKGVVHRDIKPENVMIRADGYVKVLDFGIAKLTEQFSDSEAADAPTRLQVETAEGVVMGTAPYMSPEQARGLRVDARTDIWSFGVTLYETVTGRKPFWGDTTQDILTAVLERQPPPLSRFESNVPEALEWIVSKALRKEVAARYQSATELLADLKELRRKLEFEAEQERSSAPSFSAAAGASARSDSLEARTSRQAVLPTSDKGPTGSASSAEYLVTEIGKHKIAALIALALIIAAGFVGVYVYSMRGGETAITSLAVLPLVNVGADPETEYLSDGITESVINNLSRLGTLRLTARSTVFRYKGREIDPQKIGQELGVDAVLTGKLVQRGDTLSVQADLVKVSDGSQIWGEQYNRKLADLVSLQSEISRDVSQKLRTQLSGADQQKLAKNYTANPEAYRLYLKGRYHVGKVTRSQIQTGISFFRQAIQIDPSYALAYAGLAEGYRSLGLAGEMPPKEVFPQAKAAAQRAIEIDDTLAEAHAVLGYIIFWYDWDWKVAEDEIKRALDLNPDSADAHHSYAHLLSNTGRHREALAEAKRARELDPLDLRINALGGQFFIHAGQVDEALALLLKVIELDSNYWLAHSFAASAYIEKGMFDQAIVEARKAREPPVSSIPAGFLGFALARSGKQAEARAVLEELLKSAREQYISDYAIAMIYNGLDERDQAFARLEKAYQNREPRMTFLKVEPKWKNLRDDPRFQDLLRRVGFPA